MRLYDTARGAVVSPVFTAKIRAAAGSATKSVAPSHESASPDGYSSGAPEKRTVGAVPPADGTEKIAGAPSSVNAEK